MKQPAGGSGHRKKHARGGGSTKHHHNKPKHNPQTQPKPHHKQQKPPVHVYQKNPKGGGSGRGLALADGPACCTSEALAAALRLTGRPVTDSAVLALHERVRDATDAGASILATLEAAATWGLGGVRPVSFAPVGADDPAALILGVSLPGAHAVATAGGRWSSWGGWWPPVDWPDAVIEEAWSVTWP